MSELIIGLILVLTVYLILIVGYKTMPKVTRISFWISIVIGIGAVGTCVYVGLPAKIQVEENQLVIHGAYGVTIPIKEITNVEIREQLPSTGVRTNGLSFMSYHKGRFQVKELGSCLFFLHSDKGTYLIIFSQNDPPVIINRSTVEEVQRLYNQLRLE